MELIVLNIGPGVGVISPTVENPYEVGCSNASCGSRTPGRTTLVLANADPSQAGSVLS